SARIRGSFSSSVQTNSLTGATLSAGNRSDRHDALAPGHAGTVEHRDATSACDVESGRRRGRFHERSPPLADLLRAPQPDDVGAMGVEETLGGGPAEGVPVGWARWLAGRLAVVIGLFPNE